MTKRLHYGSKSVILVVDKLNISNMSHTTTDTTTDYLLDCDWRQLNQLLCQGKISLDLYDELIDQLERTCPHEKSEGVFLYIGGRGEVPHSICQHCGLTTRLN